MKVVVIWILGCCIIAIAIAAYLKSKAANRRIDRYNRNVDRHNQLMERLQNKNEETTNEDEAH